MSDFGFEFRYDTEAYGGFCTPNIQDAFAELADAAVETLNVFYTEVVGESGA